MKRLLPLIFVILCSAAMAESGTYRIEVIIFRNLAVIAEAAETAELRNFSQFPSLEKSVPAIELPDELVENPVALVPEERPEELSVEPTEVMPEPLRADLPDDLIVIAQKGAQMEDAWRRLRSSKNYQPLLYGAWEQNRTEYYPSMRIHNQQIIDTQLRPPTDIMFADLTVEDPLAAYRSTFYQLDGSLQLRRSRFLHLFLDFEIREEKPQAPAQSGFFTEIPIQTGTVTGAGNAIGYDIFALKQNRQIRTGRMQYFDSPYFGVLVFVTAIAAK